MSWSCMANTIAVMIGDASLPGLEAGNEPPRWDPGSNNTELTPHPDLTLNAILEAKAEQERLVKASGLDWIIVRPGGLTDGPCTDAYRFGTDPTLKAGRVSRADVADFVVRQLSEDGFLHQAPAVT